MTVYNGGLYLKEAIESILAQTYSNFEFLIYDHGSTDNSLAIINSYKDKRIKVFCRTQNTSYTTHLNHGINIAKGVYVARMDQDDISLPNRFEKQIQFLEKNTHIDLVGCFGLIINRDGDETGKLHKPVGPETIKRTFLYYGPHIHPTIMFRKSVVKKVGSYRKKYTFVEDIDLYYRLIFAGYKTDNIPEYLFKYRVHSLSTNIFFKEKNWKSFKLKWEIQKKFKLKFSLTEIVSIYLHYILGLLFSFEQKTKIERLVKKLISR